MLLHCAPVQMSPQRQQTCCTILPNLDEDQLVLFQERTRCFQVPPSRVWWTYRARTVYAEWNNFVSPHSALTGIQYRGRQPDNDATEVGQRITT